MAQLTDRAEDGIDALARKYTDDDRFTGRTEGQRRVKLVLTPTRVLGGEE